VETGLYYNRFRYYSPEEGMYVTAQDPIRLMGGNRLYGYVHDPNAWLDVFGLWPFFRGAKGNNPVDFTPRDPTYDAKGKQISGDYQIDKTTGLVKNTHGVSVFDNENSIKSKGFVPYEIDQTSVSDKLIINCCYAVKIASC
jgi:hypothetical protein